MKKTLCALAFAGGAAIAGLSAHEASATVATNGGVPYGIAGCSDPPSSDPSQSCTWYGVVVRNGMMGDLFTLCNFVTIRPVDDPTVAPLDPRYTYVIVPGQAGTVGGVNLQPYAGGGNANQLEVYLSEMRGAVDTAYLAGLQNPPVPNLWLLGAPQPGCSVNQSGVVITAPRALIRGENDVIPPTPAASH